MLTETFAVISVLLITLGPIPATGGCCNTNYWCDGDPSFRETPDVAQPPYTNIVTVTWSEAYLNLVKCVDYFYVEYVESDGYGDRNFTFSPVTFERKALLDDWEDSIKPLLSKYSSSFVVEYDTDYIIRVVAVDKGAGWGEFEGRAIVYSKPIHYHSRPFMVRPEPPDPATLIRQQIERRYPPGECSKRRMCEALAKEWAKDVTDHAARFTLPYQDPKFLPPIDVMDEDRRRRYEEGKLHHLSKFETNVTEMESNQSYNVVNVTLRFRLLRTSYLWHSFFSHGILSLYHTCGQRLPIAIFRDVDVDDVEEAVSSNCLLPVVVQLIAPKYPEDNFAKVSQVFVHLQREDFRFDVTWFSSHFHNLDLLWEEQEVLIREKIYSVLDDAFTLACLHNRPEVWIKKKFQSLENEIQLAQNDTSIATNELNVND